MTKQPTPDDYAEADRRAKSIDCDTSEEVRNCYRTALATAIANEPTEAERAEARRLRKWLGHAGGEWDKLARLLDSIAGPEPVDPLVEFLAACDPETGPTWAEERARLLRERFTVTPKEQQP